MTTTTTPPTRPLLRIESGMHQAVIRRIAVDKDERFLVTASEDKTARVWDLESGALLTTLRPPIGDDALEGKLYAVAITPDGATVAVGGWTAASARHLNIYLFDRASGRLIQRIGGLPEVVFHLTFSADGHLAATLCGRNGLRIYDAADDWREVFRDTDYGADSYWAAFDHQGRLVTSCYDGLVRLYDAAFRLLAKVKPKGGEQPFGVAFSPDGGTIAVGFDHTTAVTLLDGHNLQPRGAADTNGVDNGDLSKVAWSQDGAWLYAGGRAQDNSQRFIRRWAADGQGAFQDLVVADNTIMNLRPLKAGRLAFSMGTSWGVLDAAGGIVPHGQGALADLRDIGTDFRLSADGTRVRFALEPLGKRPMTFDLASRTLTSGEAADLSPPRLAALGLAITDWKDTLAPKLNGKTLQLHQYEHSTSLAIAPDERSFLLGADWSLRRFDRAGCELWPQPIPTPATAWAVNVSADGHLAVAGFADGTIRWYRMSDGQELLALFVTKGEPSATPPQEPQWVAWTPSGYYLVSPTGGEELIGWHVNRGADKEADFFRAAQLRTNFYRPEVVASVLQTLDEAEAVRRAGVQPAQTVASVLPPVLELLRPLDGETFDNPRVKLRYRVRSNSLVREVRILVDDSPHTVVPGGMGGRLLMGIKANRTIDLPMRNVALSLIAENEHGESQPATIRLHWVGKANEPVKPKLYLLAVGVEEYPYFEEDNLDYSAKDANDFVGVFADQEGEDGLYQKVFAEILPNAERGDVIEGLNWLKDQVTEHDVAVVFLSGHGHSDNQQRYYFLTHDTDPERLEETSVTQDEIREALGAIPGKVLVFIDTCYAGSAMAEKKKRSPTKRTIDISKLVMEFTTAKGRSVIVFAAATATQSSLEWTEWQNSAFTKALVEGLRGGADYHKDGAITVNALMTYVSHRVKELTDNQQTPVIRNPGTVPDFPIAVVSPSGG